MFYLKEKRLKLLSGNWGKESQENQRLKFSKETIRRKKVSKRLKMVKLANSESQASRKQLRKICLQGNIFGETCNRGPAKSAISCDMVFRSWGKQSQWN